MKNIHIQPRLAIGVLLAAIGIILFGLSTSVEAGSSCTTTPTDKGVVNATISIPNDGNYKIWSRIKASGGGNDSYLLKVDGTCFTIGNNGLTADQWEWTNNEDGVGSANMDLTTGNHSITLAGLEENVGVDRVLFLADQDCVPSGTGDNCADADDTVAPTITLSNPVNNSTVSGTVSITATASDNVEVDRVEFKIDGALVGSDTSAPYSYDWDTNQTTDGSHQVEVVAFDTSNNSKTASATVTVENTQAVGSVTISVLPASETQDIGQQYTYTIQVDSGTDNMDTAQVRLSYDTQKLIHVETDTSNSDFNTAGQSADGSNYIEIVRGSTSPLSGVKELAKVKFEAKKSQGAHSLSFDAGESFALFEGVALTTTHNNGAYTVDDLSAPSTPTGLNADTVTSDQVVLTWSASSDNDSVDHYVVRRNGIDVATNITSTSYTDNNVSADTQYDYQVQAVDPSGNQSNRSATLSVFTTAKDGDFNNDGSVNVLDLSIFLNSWGTNDPVTDMNGDGLVNIFDFSLFLSKWGT
ncbi:MAG: Ig-like domain-containing protein [Candidatus Saccharimonadales bacterium]|nr:Ig-like domain-containing protein [Candidatus Saccharimonadales bacterium]